MHLLTALSLLEKRPAESRADVFDCAVNLHGADAWAEAATAAVMLSGYLDDAVTDSDLDEGLGHFQTCHAAGVISDEQWRQTMDEVISARMAELEAQGAFAGEVVGAIEGIQ